MPTKIYQVDVFDHSYSVLELPSMPISVGLLGLIKCIHSQKPKSENLVGIDQTLQISGAYSNGFNEGVTLVEI